MSENERLTTMPRDRVCRVCGCTDSEACDTVLGPCAWAVTYDDHTGICTACDVDFVDAGVLPVHHLDDDADGRARGVCGAEATQFDMSWADTRFEKARGHVECPKCITLRTKDTPR